MKFWLAQEILAQDEYINQSKQLILKSIELDPTLVLHDDEEISFKYYHSLIAVKWNRMIANSSLYDTSMKPLDKIIVNENIHKIGEIGSVVVDSDYRNSWIGKKLLSETISILWNKYSWIVMATICNSMYHIAGNNWFTTIPFPWEYYNEWKKYLAPRLNWWVQEFENRAKCLFLGENIRVQIIEIIKKSND